ncbi:mechanosensitive ion channel [[Bacteroides] pectinophilus]|uniref:Small-conductance mechanosensitive channel n=1 Tax=[Bacteroides] pectinophilus ATCC 43243 TaxID=483218 RepID=B7AQ65_9FIRM|nr:transporter, small conductance mechanosensitive ion channel MscS family protein [[Bacteroides] pectinophilus ATCC 43243]UWN96911.1 mechanosensitive ion channel [[Bacteroides] pectinophilus]
MNNILTAFAQTAEVKDVKEVVEETQRFFTMNDMRTILDKFIEWCASTVGTIVWALIVWVIGKKILKALLKVLGKALDRSRLDEGVTKFMLSLSRFAGNVVLVIMIIDILGFDTTSFIAVLGSAGIALGMSLQGSLANVAGGILILLFKPFAVGDYIVAGGYEGNVTTIDLLYTKLITIDNKMVTIPNGTLSNSSIVNVASQPQRRLDIQIGIGYSSDLKLAKRLLLDAMNKQAGVLTDKDIMVVVKSLDDSCVTLETRCWVMTSDYWNVRFALLEGYKETFDDNGIEIPFNQMDVHIVQ